MKAPGLFFLRNSRHFVPLLIIAAFEFLPALAATAAADAPSSATAFTIRPTGIQVTRARKLRGSEDDFPFYFERGLKIDFEIASLADKPVANLREVILSRALDDTSGSLIGRPIRLESDSRYHSGDEISGSLSIEEEVAMPPIPRSGSGVGAVAQALLFGMAAARSGPPGFGMPGGDYRITDKSTVKVSLKLGLPAREAKALRVLEGAAVIEIGNPRTVNFPLEKVKIGEPLDLGTSDTLEVTVEQKADDKLSLSVSGDQSRLGRIVFLDSRGRSITSWHSSMSSFGGDETRLEFEPFRFGPRSSAKPATLRIGVFDTTEPTTATIKIENIELP